MELGSGRQVPPATRRERERGERERIERERARERERGERETTGYETFALHAPIHWAIEGYVIKSPCLSGRPPRAQLLPTRAPAAALPGLAPVPRLRVCVRERKGGAGRGGGVEREREQRRESEVGQSSESE